VATYDALVIGAGAAGLAAARLLSGAGKRVCILEARERTGGRVWTRRLPDLAIPIELGAEFIHGDSPETLSIADASAVPTVELPDTHWWSDEGRWSIIRDFWGEVDRVQRRIPRSRDRSFEAFLRSQRTLTPRLEQLARGFVEGYHAAHADRISALALRSADGEQSEAGSSGNRQYRIATGQDRIIEWLLTGIDPRHSTLRLGTIVSAVEWKRGSVVIHTQSAVTRAATTIRARTLVITIPIGVWKAAHDQPGAIRFDPPLREKTRALASIEAAHVVKIIFRFRERFWDDIRFAEERLGKRPGEPMNFLHSSDRYMPTWWTSSPIRSPVLTGWAGGHAADALLAEGSAALVDRSLDSLSRVWRVPRRRLDGMLLAAYTHEWQSDPFSRCAYSYAAVGGRNAAGALARPLQGTLFFAGEATNAEETGTVAGAIASGFRAARQLLRATQ
jgi:monoamine oxidase